MALETRETTQPPSRAKLNGRIVQVTGNTRGVGAAIGRSLASKLGRLGRPDGVARVVRFLFADGCSLITGRVWALDGRGEM
jgi:NAD(P)-dependent dehydrogenase (short-subunit alcohol dehydrogenase family)